MKGRFLEVMVALTTAAAAVLPAAGVAAGAMHTTTAAHTGRIMKCPICTMPMPSRKAPGAPVRVHVGKHYYYCCAKCGYKGTQKPLAHPPHPMPHM